MAWKNLYRLLHFKVNNGLLKLSEITSEGNEKSVFSTTEMFYFTKLCLKTFQALNSYVRRNILFFLLTERGCNICLRQTLLEYHFR